MILKNKVTGSIGTFSEYQGEDWRELTETELSLKQKKKLIAEYKAERDAKLAEDFLVNINGADFVVNHSDIGLITSITEHLQEQTGTVSHKWTDINGNSVDLPPIAFSIIREAILERAQEARHTYNEQVKALNNSTTQTTILNHFEA